MILIEIVINDDIVDGLKFVQCLIGLELLRKTLTGVSVHSLRSILVVELCSMLVIP